MVGEVCFDVGYVVVWGEGEDYLVFVGVLFVGY